MRFSDELGEFLFLFKLFLVPFSGWLCGLCLQHTLRFRTFLGSPACENMSHGMANYPTSLPKQSMYCHYSELATLQLYAFSVLLQGYPFRLFFWKFGDTHSQNFPELMFWSLRSSSKPSLGFSLGQPLRIPIVESTLAKG